MRLGLPAAGAEVRLVLERVWWVEPAISRLAGNDQAHTLTVSGFRFPVSGRGVSCNGVMVNLPEVDKVPPGRGFWLSPAPPSAKRCAKIYPMIVSLSSASLSDWRGG